MSNPIRIRTRGEGSKPEFKKKLSLPGNDEVLHTLTITAEIEKKYVLDEKTPRKLVDEDESPELGPDLKFDWENEESQNLKEEKGKERKQLPYLMQGDKKFEQPDYIAARRKLEKNDRIQKAIMRFWPLYNPEDVDEHTGEAPDNTRVTWENYFMVYARIAKVF